VDPPPSAPAAQAPVVSASPNQAAAPPSIPLPSRNVATSPATTFSSAALAAPATTAAPAATPPAGTRGLLNLVSWWNQNHEAAPANQCLAEGEQPVGTERAWLLRTATVACYDDQPFVTWGGRMIDVNIYFPGQVDEQQAIAVALSVLPADSNPIGTFDGANRPYSAKPNGSCRQTVYTSSTLAAAVRQANPTWSVDPAKATVTLYSGHATSSDGADKAYVSSSVNLASIAIGPENRGSDGAVGC
jgi:hypothetical protein